MRAAPPAQDRRADRLPATLRVERRGEIAILSLDRAAKRNALDDAMVLGLEAYFSAIPEGVRAVVLRGMGDHFCAGLDLGELEARSVADGIAHSMMWHRAFARIQFGQVPVVAVLHGAVVGGGLELACAAHIRVADNTAFYGLPEGARGIFVGGGGAVRLPRLIGAARMADMMLTGRVYGAAEGQQFGLSHYLVGAGEGLAKAIELARRIAANVPLTNFAIMHALPRIADSGHEQGLFTEALMAAIAQGQPEAKARLADFMAKRAPKVGKPR